MTDWSKWSPTLIAAASVAVGAGGVLAQLNDLEARLVRIEAEVVAHTEAEGHTPSIRRIDHGETERGHVRELMEAQTEIIRELQKSLRRVDRRTEALCADSPRCRKDRNR